MDLECIQYSSVVDPLIFAGNYTEFADCMRARRFTALFSQTTVIKLLKCQKLLCQDGEYT